jgi:hypothetical protein
MAMVQAESEPEPDDHGHDHCFVAVHRRELSMLSAPGVALPNIEPSVQCATVAHGPDWGLALVPLRLAPKTSPPSDC